MSMKFDPHVYQYDSRRNVVYATNGMVHCSQPQVAQIGLDIMKQGGNAIDAAVAMAAAATFMEPVSNALGADCFAQIWTKGKLYAINGSGVSPMALDLNAVNKAGLKHPDRIPLHGWLSAMVPGAPRAWEMIRSRFGTKSMKELMAPAIRYAREGYPVPVTVSRFWAEGVPGNVKRAKENPEAFGPCVKMFTKDGVNPYKAGDVFKCPEVAETLEKLAESNCESLYTGELMKRTVEFSKKTGGYFEESDFINYKPEWVEPLHINYRGYDVYELPPNGQGITALMALNILKEMDLGETRDSIDGYHKQIEAMKLAFADTKKYVADPRYMKVKTEEMLSDSYAAKRRAMITDEAIMPEPTDPWCGGTIYFCTADKEGNMVSFIQSDNWIFGSGLVVPGTGIVLQARARGFSLDPESDNCVAGGKRAYHTIIPGFLMKDGKPVGPFGVMGGFMQPQGHLQVLVNSINYHMNPQSALDAPRFQWIGGKHVQLERTVPEFIAMALAAKGHEIEIVNDNIDMGRGGIIWRRDDGVMCGGTEPRCDGTLLSY